MNIKFSFDCEELIAEIKEDIFEFGEDFECFGVWAELEYPIPFSEKTVKQNTLIDYFLHDEDIDSETLGAVRLL